MNIATAATAPTNTTDIAICGAGPVGMALALMLLEQGMAAEKILLIDGKTAAQASQDPRSIALSYGSAQLLQAIAAWPLTTTPIHQIHISRRAYFGRTLIDRADVGVPALGYVTRYGELVSALSQRCIAAGIPLLRPVHLRSATETTHGVALRLDDERVLHAEILVQAEGGVYLEQSTKSTHRDYGQSALVAHVKVSRPLAQRAFERFTDEGPLALLPQDDGYALVWCASAATIDALMLLSEAEFLQRLEHAFGSRLGHFTHAGVRGTYVLGLNADPAASSRIVAIGNAAQTLHPVAGQGLNLGLRDAAVLARRLAHHPTPSVLAEFQRSRSTDRSSTIWLTDLMARAFISPAQGSLTQMALGLSLGLTDVIKPLKKRLAEQMMFGQRDA